MIKTYLLAAPGKTDTPLAERGMMMIRDKLIKTFVSISGYALIIQSDYGRYFLSHKIKEISGLDEYIFCEMNFDNFGGKIDQNVWDDMERTIENSLDVMFAADEAALLEEQHDNVKYLNRFNLLK